MPRPKLPKPGDQAIIDPADVGAAMPVAADSDEQKKLKTLIARRHPEYKDSVPHWSFLEETYEGGREWFEANIFKYVKEGDGEFADRIQRAYRFNHTREVVDLVNKYLFKQNIIRSDDAPDCVKQFWAVSTKNGLGIRDLSRQASKKASTLGRIGVVVDNTSAPAVEGTQTGVISKADEKKADIKTYAYIVGPEQLLDYSHDDNGDLRWILIEECTRDDADPYRSSGAESPRYRLWTTTDWKLYEERKQGKKTIVVLVGEGKHDIGEVPVILHDNMIGDEPFVPPSLIDDIAYLDRAVANYLSNLDAIIQDQTFSQLAMPAQNMLPGEDSYTKMTEMSTKRVFLFDGEGGGKPEYISPDPKQAQMILAVINKIINEIYHTVGLAGERTKQDNALGIDNSSGVAKAYDFERVNALLAAKAASLGVLENKLTRLVGKWNDVEIDKDLVSYPDNFDTRGLYDEFDIAARLMLVEAPDAVRQKQMEQLIDKLFPQLAKNLRDEMLKQLKDWPVDPVELAGSMAEATANGSLLAQQALQKTADRGTAKETMAAQ
jgi:hypothetical protein